MSPENYSEIFPRSTEEICQAFLSVFFCDFFRMFWIRPLPELRLGFFKRSSKDSFQASFKIFSRDYFMNYARNTAWSHPGNSSLEVSGIRLGIPTGILPRSSPLFSAGIFSGISPRIPLEISSAILSKPVSGISPELLQNFFFGIPPTFLRDPFYKCSRCFSKNFSLDSSKKSFRK